MTHQVKERKAMDVGYLYISEVFDTLSHRIILEKLVGQCLNRYTFAGLKTSWMTRPREWW